MSHFPTASGDGGPPRRHSREDAPSTAPISNSSTMLPPHWENEARQLPASPTSTRNDATPDQPDIRTFETEFLNHRQAVRTGNMDKAIQSFIMLQTSSGQNEEFQRYLVDVANEIDPGRDSELSKFFASLPALIQSTIVENVAAYWEDKDILRAFQVLFDYIQAYPRHAYKYLIRAIDLLILCAQSLETKEQEHSEKCIKMLVTELLQRLWKQRILLTGRDRQPMVKSTESKHHIVIPYSSFEQYLAIGQRYYIGQRDWNELVKFTCAMLDCCGYSGLTRLDFLSHTNRFQYMKEQRGNIRIDQDDTEEGGSENAEDIRVLVAFMCETMAAASQIVQFGNDYYKSVCAGDDGKDEKSCLIPICAMQPSFSSAKAGRQDIPSETQSREGTVPITSSEKSTTEEEDNSRKRKGSERDSEEANNEEQQQSDSEHRTKKPKLDDMLDRGKGLDSYCMRGVDDALQTLSKAADCMRHMVDLWQWAVLVAPKTNWVNVFGSWEQELCRVIEEYKLPFDIYNAVLLVRSDLALSSPSIPGNLAKALKLSQDICDRIEIQRRRESRETSRSSEYDIPFMFAFRVLYNIGVIYLLVGSIQQSTLEIAIILSVFPIPEGLDEKDFIADEIDCHTIASIFQGHEFGLMRVTQEGLVVRCMKHLVVSLSSESEQRGGMASIDSAMRWDEKAGNMIVLMQYGWPYWRERTNFWHKITQRMKEKRVFKNREFLEYVYVPEILQTIQTLHETDTVTLDIIPPEFALRSSYRNLALSSSSNASPSVPSSPQPTSVASPSAAASDISQTEGSEASNRGNDASKQLPSLGSLPLTTTGSSPAQKQTAAAAPPPPPPPPPIYQPSFTNTILPSMSMSPTWYSPSHQKNTHANWMSPSFYYSRPATSVMLPKKESSADKSCNGAGMSVEQLQRSFVPKDIVTRCLEYRVRRYSPKMTPQRMRHVLQKFLKNMVLRANEDL